MFEPKIVKNKEETIERLKCGDWSYSYDEQWTNIFNESGQKIVTVYLKLDFEQVRLYKIGFENGFTSGREFGKLEKGEEIRKILKI